jgi:hypothetical protein
LAPHVALLNLKINWNLECRGLNQVEADCSVKVSVDSAPPGVVAKLYTVQSPRRDPEAA